MLSSALITAGIVSIALLIDYADRREFSNELRFSSVIKPVGHQWVKAKSSDEFFSDLSKLKTKIDVVVQEGPREKPAKE
jgi:hypothetical protein